VSPPLSTSPHHPNSIHELGPSHGHEPHQGPAPELEDPSEPTGVAALGAAVLDLIAGAFGLYSVFVRTLYYIVRGRSEKGAILAQMYEIGNKSLFFITVVMGFLGMILVYQAGLQALRVVPDLTLLGATYLELLVRDLAASIGALMLATRVGAGIAAEIGSMVVTEQVDALRMCAADPIDYLIKPRFVASVIMTTVLVIWSAAVAFTAGLITAYSFFGVLPRTFINVSLVDVGDLSIGLAKCIAYGAAIPIVSGYYGLSTFGGSEGVGWATTRAVVNSSLAVIILNFFISGAGFIIFPG
jgi:phospholipid/cholesterol/gamma-HCH transport system permease protein